jgi:hypothetical protein
MAMTTCHQVRPAAREAPALEGDCWSRMLSPRISHDCGQLYSGT